VRNSLGGANLRRAESSSGATPPDGHDEDGCSCIAADGNGNYTGIPAQQISPP
jgi:hypothetical protein